MTTIVGITGYAGAGKDTAAAAMVRELGYTRIALADPIKEAIATLNPWVPVSVGYSAPIEALLVESGWDDWVLGSDSFREAWDVVKGWAEARRLLQVFGTQVGREMFGDDVWLQTMLRKAAGHDKVVVPDVRFRNEAQTIIDAGGLVVGIDRPGVGPLNEHSSEAGGAIELAGLWVPNNDTQQGFEALVVDALSHWRPLDVSQVYAVSGPQGGGCRTLLCPDCKAGKHGNCDSTSWCIEHDHSSVCPCEDISH